MALSRYKSLEHIFEYDQVDSMADSVCKILIPAREQAHESTKTLRIEILLILYNIVVSFSSCGRECAHLILVVIRQICQTQSAFVACAHCIARKTHTIGEKPNAFSN